MENDKNRNPDSADRNLQTSEPQNLGSQNPEAGHRNAHSISHYGSNGRDLENHERYNTHADRTEEEEGDREYFNKI